MATQASVVKMIRIQVREAGRNVSTASVKAQKAMTRMSIYPAVALPRMCPEESKSRYQREACTPMLIATLFKTPKQSSHGAGGLGGRAKGMQDRIKGGIQESNRRCGYIKVQ